MIDRVIKRDGRKVRFSKNRIRRAVSRAMDEANVSRYGVMDQVTGAIINAIHVKYDGQTPSVEDIQDTIVKVLKEMKLGDVATAFLSYRADRTKTRETKSDIMKAIARIGEETDRDNANVGNNFSAKLLQIASVANKWYNLANMPKEHAKAHETGDVHIHDLDSFNLTANCLQIDLKYFLENGFNTGYGYIRPAKRIEAGAEQACILLQSSQNDMFGGQGFPEFERAFVPLIKKTRKEIEDEYERLIIEHSGDGWVANSFPQAVEEKLSQRTHQAMQAMCYNLNTMHARAGAQVPFSSINIGAVIGEDDEDAPLITQAFLEEYEKGLGKGEQPIFPNIIYRLKKGVNLEKDDPNRYLTDIAIRVAARRMNPTFKFLDCVLDKALVEQGITPALMGCRTYIGDNLNGEKGPLGRGNIAPISINLPRIGIEANRSWDKFYTNLEKTMELCAEELLFRYDTLKKLKVKDLPFVAGQRLIKGSEGLGPDDSIEPIIKQGTWGIGFIGLAETMVAMTGYHHGEGAQYWEKAYQIAQFMKNKVDEFKKKYQLNFTYYATPAEGLSGRFTAIDKKRYGIIPGVTDKEYYTNSYHIPVKFSISAIDKIRLEAPFHKLCNAGHITYVELDGGSIEDRVRFIDRMITIASNNTDISYLAFNFHIRNCKDCGIDVAEHMGSCPVCGSTEIQGISRVTGYMSLDERFSPGKVAERADRIKHEM